MKTNNYSLNGHRQDAVTVGSFYLTIVLFNIVDIITSFQLLKGEDFTAGQIFKGAIFIVLLILNMRHSHIRGGLFLVLGLLYYFIIVETANYLFYQYDVKFLWRGLSFSMKATLPFMFYFYYVSMCRKGAMNYDVLKRGVYFYVMLFSLNMIAPAMSGVSRLNYERSGFTGLYYAGNDVGAYLTVTFPIMFYFFLRDAKHRVLTAILLVLLVISGILTGAKTPLISIMLSVTIIPILLTRNRRRWLFAVPILMFGVYVVLMLYGQGLLDYLPRSVYGRLIWTIQTRDSFLDILLGVRLEYLAQYIDNIKSKGFFGLLFGNGFVNASTFMYRYTGMYKAAEMDGVDIIARYGFVGIIIVSSMIYKVLKTHYEPRLELSLIVTYMLCLLVFNALLAGHVFGNAFNMLVLGIILTMNKAEHMVDEGNVQMSKTFDGVA